MSLGKRVMVSSRMNWLFKYQASARLEASWFAEQKAQRPPAALAIPGRDGVAYQLVETVAAQGGDSHGIFRLLGISDQAVPRRDPDCRNRPGFNHRRFNSIKEGEQVVFLSVEEHAAQKVVNSLNCFLSSA